MEYLTPPSSSTAASMSSSSSPSRRPLLASSTAASKMDHGGKKPRVQLPNLTLGEQVKQESNHDEQETSRATVVAAAAAPVAKVALEFDKPLLDCPLCSLPVKPPVFQCRAKHAACAGCAASRSNKCASCADGVYEHIHWLDPYVLAAKVRCPNEAYGCRSSVPYCMAGEHQLVCAHAPCCCPEPGCIFLGSPPTLRNHLASHHKLLVTPITFGKCVLVEMQPAERRRLLAADDGEHVFLVVASERGGQGERHVKVVRVRASADEEASWYRCKVWTDGPVDAKTGCKDVLMLEAKVRSCAKPSEEAAMDLGGRCLQVPSDTPPAAEAIVLRVRIDKLEIRAPVPVADK